MDEVREGRDWVKAGGRGGVGVSQRRRRGKCLPNCCTGYGAVRYYHHFLCQSWGFQGWQAFPYRDDQQTAPSFPPPHGARATSICFRTYAGGSGFVDAQHASYTVGSRETETLVLCQHMFPMLQNCISARTHAHTQPAHVHIFHRSTPLRETKQPSLSSTSSVVFQPKTHTKQKREKATHLFNSSVVRARSGDIRQMVQQDLDGLRLTRPALAADQDALKYCGIAGQSRDELENQRKRTNTRWTQVRTHSMLRSHCRVVQRPREKLKTHQRIKRTNHGATSPR